MELKNYFGTTPLAIVLTTDVDDAERGKRVIARNEVAREVAKKYSLPVVDIYPVSVKYASCRTDGVHFNAEGYQALAEAIVSATKEILA